MANLKIEGNTKFMSENQLKFIIKVLEERGYKNNKVVIEAVGKKGDNYVANVKRVIVETEGETFTMIAKVAPTVEAIRGPMNVAVMFKNEQVMYTEVFPKLAELQEEIDVLTEKILRFPVCYGSLSEAPNEIILLEDLKKHDFLMLDRFQSLTDKTIRLALEQIAVLHSLSFVLKHKYPEKYDTLKNKLVNAWVNSKYMEETKVYFTQLEKDVISVLDNNKYIKIIDNTIAQLPDNCIQLCNFDAVSKYSVIIQGDCWTNNMMFRLEKNEPKDVILIDYQLSVEGNPSADILYLIFNCTDHEIRLKYFNKWIDHYYSVLDDSLTNYGLQVSSVYPRDQLDVDLKRQVKVSLGMSCMLAYFLVRDSEDAISFSDNPELLQNKIEDAMETMSIKHLNERTQMRFKNKIEGTVESLLQFGYLNNIVS